MAKDRNKAEAQIEEEYQTLQVMVGMYCPHYHHDEQADVQAGDAGCEECQALLAYARRRIEKCSLRDDKPPCSKCLIHCYKSAMREKVREVMRFAGPRMALHHPVRAVKHVIQSFKHRAPKDPKAEK